MFVITCSGCLKPMRWFAGKWWHFNNREHAIDPYVFPSTSLQWGGAREEPPE